MTRKKLFTTIVLTVLSISSVTGQAIKVTPNSVSLDAPVLIDHKGGDDGFCVTTKNSSKVLPNDADLIWGAFYQNQPNNPGLFALSSFSSPMPSWWQPCFIVRANGKVGIMNPNPSVALEIGSSSLIQQVKVNGNIVWGSDARMKEEVQELSNSLAKLRKLRGVSYRLKEDKKEVKIPQKLTAESSLDKKQADEMQESLLDRKNELLTRNFYGFLAQDVRELFPDLVYEDENTGMLSVDYIGLIPVLVNALEDQQSQLEDLQNQLNDQQSQIQSILQAIADDKLMDPFARGTGSMPVLHQNTPNPFHQSTTIAFYIPESIQTANLYVYDMQGFQKNSFLITERNNGSIQLDASSLSPGLYFYTLICDGKPVDAKQMILTK